MRRARRKRRVNERVRWGRAVDAGGMAGAWGIGSVMRCSTVRAVRAQVREKRRVKGRWVQVRRRERNGAGETAGQGTVGAGAKAREERHGRNGGRGTVCASGRGGRGTARVMRVRRMRASGARALRRVSCGRCVSGGCETCGGHAGVSADAPRRYTAAVS